MYLLNGSELRCHDIVINTGAAAWGPTALRVSTTSWGRSGARLANVRTFWFSPGDPIPNSTRTCMSRASKVYLKRLQSWYPLNRGDYQTKCRPEGVLEQTGSSSSACITAVRPVRQVAVMKLYIEGCNTQTRYYNGVTMRILKSLKHWNQIDRPP